MSNRHLALFISLLLVSFFGGCTATPPSGPAFPHQLIQSGSMTVPYNSSVSWMVPFPTGNKAINPLQSSTVGLDTRISWHHNMTANSCFNLTTTVGIARANGVPVGNTLTLYSKVLCLQPDSAQLLDSASPVSPCQLNQLVEASQDITGIQLQLTMSIQKPNNPALPYEPLSITTNASVVFASTQITNQWQWDSNVLCQSVRYYMAHSKMRTNPVFSITNESSPSVGLGSVGGCLPDNLGHVIATYSGGKVTQSGTVLHWKATNVPKGTLSLSVEVNGANGVPTTVCSMYAKIDLKTSDDQHDTRVVLAVTFSLVGAAIIFVAVIVLIGKYRAKKAADYTQIP